jgi:hypothetical protein
MYYNRLERLSKDKRSSLVGYMDSDDERSFRISAKGKKRNGWK